MKLIKTSTILFCLLTNVTNVYGQDNKEIKEQDSISKKAYIYLTQQFSVPRPLNIEYTYATPTKFTSKTDGNKTDGNRINHYSQLNISTNINILKKKNWILSTTLGYKNTNMDVEFAEPTFQETKNVDINAHYHYESLNLAYSTKLFNKPTFLSSSLIVDGSDKYFGRVKGLITGNILLKSTDRTKILVGLGLNIDEGAITPVIPMFTLQHRFNNDFFADIILPKQILFRMHPFKNSRLSIGTELEANTFYLYHLNPNNLSEKYEYRQVDLNNGLKYEYLLKHNFIITAKTGVKTLITNGLFNKKDTFDDKIFSSTQDPSFYFNLGLSYNPFVKKRK